MSWYKEATDAIVALINAAIEERGDMPEPKEITDIIAKHDPNRWVPVTEAHPISTGSAERRVHLVASRDNRIIETEMRAKFVNPAGWDFWREIVLPEVKG